MTIRSFAPVSCGNFCVGFDMLGAAFAPVDGSLWGDEVEVEIAAQTSYHFQGDYADLLPQDPQKNLIALAYDAFGDKLRQRQIPVKSLHITLHKNLMVGTGLGSSACSVVAALKAYNAIHDDILSDLELLTLAGIVESHASGSIHYDNVAPCLLGGLQLMLRSPDDLPDIKSLPFFDDLKFIVVHPHCEIRTADARQILKPDVALKTTLQQMQNMAGFMASIYSQDLDLLKKSFRDDLIEPQRKRLIPGFDAAKKIAFDHGAIGFTISGSGPSVFAIAQDGVNLENMLQGIQGAFLDAGLKSDGKICRLDKIGARIL